MHQAPKSGYRLTAGAWIHPEARIAEGVTIEPGAVIGADVQIGARCWIGAGAVIYGPTTLGEENQVFPTAVLGGPPQDLSYSGEPTRLEVGARNTFREAVTISRASTKEDQVTRIGNDCYFMAGSHVGHDCVVGDKVILANDVLIAGHCRIGNNVNMAGGVAIVQFSTVGRFAFIGGLSGTTMDCEPFLVHDDMPARPKGINVVGLRRGQFNYASINALKEAYRVLFLGMMKDALDLEAARAEIEKRGALCEEVAELLDFMKRSREGRFGRQAQHTPKVKLVPEPPKEGQS
jgi:UDP-N-acetylglucosamine acyltransferase